MLATAQVPGLINYQGRLTDNDGKPVTGSKNFAINIYDAATGGNLLYSETIGPVTLDSNGVYNFQFGSAGTSNSQVTETIATTDGSTLVYSKALSNTQIVPNSITVTDGTNSWSQVTGNPGATATATANTIAGFVIGATITEAGSGYTSAPTVTISGSGSGATATASISNGTVTGITITNAGTGYTSGATITIAPPVIPFRVDYSNGTITATYSSAPQAGAAIVATYRHGTSGITGALSNNTEQWMEINVDGFNQSNRHRILSVPLSFRAIATEKTIQNETSLLRQELLHIKKSLAQSSGFQISNVSARLRSSGTKLGVISDYGELYYNGPVDLVSIDYAEKGELILGSVLIFQGSGPSTWETWYDLGFIKYTYTDGSSSIQEWYEVNRFNGSVKKTFINPHPEKPVRYIKATSRKQYNIYDRSGISSFSVYSKSLSSITYSTNLSVKNFYISAKLDFNIVDNIQLLIKYDDGTSQLSELNKLNTLEQSKTITSVEVSGILNAPEDVIIPELRVIASE